MMTDDKIAQTVNKFFQEITTTGNQPIKLHWDGEDMLVTDHFGQTHSALDFCASSPLYESFCRMSQFLETHRLFKPYSQSIMMH